MRDDFLNRLTQTEASTNLTAQDGDVTSLSVFLSLRGRLQSGAAERSAIAGVGPTAELGRATWPRHGKLKRLTQAKGSDEARAHDRDPTRQAFRDVWLRLAPYSKVPSSRTKSHPIPCDNVSQAMSCFPSRLESFPLNKEID